MTLIRTICDQVVDYGVAQIQNLSGEIQPGLMNHVEAFRTIARTGARCNAALVVSRSMGPVLHRCVSSAFLLI